MKTITFDETKWKLVPIEPTKEMIDAWDMAGVDSAILGDGRAISADSAWSIGLNAFPKYEPEADEDGWIKCHGTRPVCGHVLVDVKLQDGDTIFSERAP